MTASCSITSTQLVPYQERVIPELEARERDPQGKGREREVAGMLLYRFAPDRRTGGDTCADCSSRPPIPTGWG